MGKHVACGLLLACLFAPVLSASNDQYQLYTFNTGVLGDPVTIRLDTRTGDSWFFDGEKLKKIPETGPKKGYRSPNYQLHVVPSRKGEVIFRLSRFNGSVWIYRQKGWQLVETVSDSQ